MQRRDSFRIAKHHATLSRRVQPTSCRFGMENVGPVVQLHASALWGRDLAGDRAWSIAAGLYFLVDPA